MKKIFTTLVLLSLLSFGTEAQIQSNYIFYNLQQTIINPAAASTYDNIYAGLLFNTQMQGFKGAPLNGMVDFGFPIGKTNLTIGGQIMYDHIGSHQSSDIGVPVAYRIKFRNNRFLSFGITPYMHLLSNDYSSLDAFQQNDETVGSGDYSVVIPNFKIGAFFYTEKFYTGLSLGNVLTFKTINEKARINIKGNNLHIYYMLGYTWTMGQNWAFRPSAMIRIYGASPLQFDINANFEYKKQFGFGASYRSLSTIVAQLSFKFKNNLKIGYAFDYGFGRFVNTTNYTGHEVYVGIEFPGRTSRSSF